MLRTFPRLAGAPGAPERLRQFVLDVAVSGRMTSQDAAERGHATKPRGRSGGSYPESWVTTTIETCFAPLADGRTLHQGWSPQCDTRPASDGEWGMLKTTSIQRGRFEPDHNKHLPASLEPRPVLQVAAGDLLITCAGPRARCGVASLVRAAPPQRLISGKMYRFRMKPEIAPEFMELFLLTSASLAAINGMKTGSSESGLNLTHQRFRQLAVVIPPLAEQHRIVAKVDELIALCDELEAAQTEREARRDRLRATSLRNFVAPHESKEHARFFLQHSPRMITKPEHVAGVRRAILDLAVRGRLVPQNLGGPSSQYSENDSAHVTSNAQTQDSFPFEVAATTTWSTLGDVIAFGPQNGISPRVSSRPEAPRAITLTATTSGRFENATSSMWISAQHPQNLEYWLRPGDLLFQRGNRSEYVGSGAALYDGAPGQFSSRLNLEVRIQPEHSSRYVHLCASPRTRDTTFPPTPPAHRRQCPRSITAPYGSCRYLSRHSRNNIASSRRWMN